MATHPLAAARRPPIRLLVLDVDGTLSNSRHEITDATCAAVARVRSAGVRVVLATGRRYRDTLPVAARLGIDAPLITASGALVKDPTTHATVLQAEFAPGVMIRVLEEIVARGHEPILYTDSFAAGYDFHCRALGTPTAEAMASASPDLTQSAGWQAVAEYLSRNAHLARVQPDLHARVPEGVFAGFTMGTRAQMEDLQEALHQACRGALSLHVIRSPRYRDWMCEFAPAVTTKWSGVLALAGIWGIEPANICAGGDDVNDLPMIRGAGLGIAMGNAVPQVLAAADLVVATTDDGGIEEIAAAVLAASPQSASLGGG